MLLACLAGLLVAAKLALLHVAVHADPTHESFCAIADAVNCDTVARSRWSVAAGLPVAVWGMLGYLWMGAFALAAWRSRMAWSWAVLLLSSGFAVLVSVALGTLSVLEIESVCVLCIASYVCNVAILVVAGYQQRGRWVHKLREAAAWSQPRLANLGLGASVIAAFVCLLVVGFPRYWEHAAATTGAETEPPRITEGITPEGYHWVGSAQPVLTIVEFSDYECPFCRRAHQELRDLVERNPGVRLVHRHYPLDQGCNPLVSRPFHRHACEAAIIAACAGEQGRFWPANDYLYAHARDIPSPTATSVARALGLDAERLDECVSTQGRQLIQHDVAQGNTLGLRGTPAFVVDGEVHLGKVPKPVLEHAGLRG